MTTILVTAQTYIGVLATFLVLCLFNSRSNNFLLATIIEMGYDILKVLREYASNLKSEIRSVYENKDDKTNDRVGVLIEKAIRINKDLYKKLIRNRNTARFLENKFFNEAMSAIDSYDPKAIRKKPELTYVALLTLAFIIVVMMVDVVELFSVEIRSLFINLLIGIGCVYSYFLYRNFFVLNYNVKANNRSRFENPNWILMVIGVFSSFLLWLFVCSLMNDPVFACLCYPFVLAVGLRIVKSKWIAECDKFHRYNRTFVLKHCFYIVLFVLLCTTLIKVMVSYSWLYELGVAVGFEGKLHDWNNAISLMMNACVAKYAALVFFTLNTFIIPLLIGYLYLKIQEKRIVSQIDSAYNKYKDKIQGYEDTFRSLEQEIEEKDTPC